MSKRGTLWNLITISALPLAILASTLIVLSIQAQATNDDTVIVGVSPTIPVVGEGAGEGYANFTIEVLGGAQLAEGATVAVSYSVRPGSAVAGSDYVDTSGDVVLSVAYPEALIQVPLVNDYLFENDEVFELVLTVGDGVMASPDVAKVTIADDDRVVVDFSPTEYEVDEDAGSLDLTLEIVAGTLAEGASVTVNYATQDATASSSRGDYMYVARVIELTSQVPGTTINVPITDDMVREPDETFLITLNGDDRVEVGADVPVTIKDNDSATVVGLNPSVYSVVEGDSTVALTIRAVGVLENDLTLNYATRDGSAKAGSDYVGASGQVTLPMGINPTADIDITVSEDIFWEPAEIFGVFLSVPDDVSLPYGVDLNTAPAVVTITNDDDATIGFRDANYTVSESGEAVVTVAVLAGTLGEGVEVEVEYSTVADVATAGSDYTAVESGIIKFGPDLTQQSITIDLVDDKIDEPDLESFTVNLSSAFIAAAPGLSLAPAVAAVLITDDDQPAIGFSSDKYEVNEDSGTVKITVGAFARALTRAVDLDYTTRAGSAVPGTDYATTAGSITLSPTVATVTFEVPIMSDHTVVEDRMFEIDLSLAAGESLPSGFSLGRTTAVVTIEDDDTITIGFTRDAYTVGEASGMVEIEVALLGGSTPLAPGATLEVEFSTAADIAQRDIDYEHIAETIQLNSTHTTTNPYIVRVPIIDDNLLEYPETFWARLSPDRDSVQIGGEDSVATITIEDDNDPITIGFADSTYTGTVIFTSGRQFSGSWTNYVANEGGYAELPVTILSGGLGRTLLLRYDVEQLTGGAVVDVDYNPIGTGEEIRYEPPFFIVSDRNGQIELGPNLTRTTIRVAITEDDIFDPGEFFSVYLSENNVPNHVDFEPQRAFVQIGDTDGPPIVLTADSRVIREDAGTVDFKIEIPDPLETDLVLSLITTHDPDLDTLDEPLDTLIIPETVTIASGQTSGTFTVEVVDDTIAELDKVLVVAVSQVESVPVSQSGIVPVSQTVDFNQVEIENSRYTYEYAAGDRPGVAVIIDSEDELVLNLETVDGTGSDGIPETESRVCVTYSDQFRYTADGSRQILELEVREATGELYSGRIYDQDGNSFYRSAVPILLEDGETRSCVNVSYANEHYAGTLLTYTVTLSRSAGLDSSVVLGDSTATIVVAENDAPGLVVNYGGVTVINEGQKLDVELILVNGAPRGLAEELTVELALIYNKSTARAADISFPSTVTIPKGANSVAFQIEALQDMMPDDGETFELALVGITPPPPVGTRVRSHSGGPIMITDADTIIVGVSPIAPIAGEDEGYANFMIGIPGNIQLAEDATVAVGYLVRPDSAVAGSDYVDTSGSVVLSAAYPAVIIQVPLINDSLFENDEAFDLVLTVEDGVTADPDIAKVTIGDDDRVTVGFNPAEYEVDENAGALSLTLEIVTGTLAEGAGVSVGWATRDATGGTSRGDAGIIELTSQMPTAAINIPITDDMVRGPDETFLVTLSGDDRVDVGADVPVTIKDNDPVTVVGLNPSVYNVVEGDSTVAVTIRAVGVLENDLTLNYATRDGSAKAGSDYVGASGRVTLPMGINPTADIDITVSEDIFWELAETFEVVLSVPDDVRLPEGVDLNTAPAVVTITNDDDVTIGFRDTTYRVSEDGEASVTVAVLSGTLGEGVEIELEYSTVADVAISGSDYTAVESGTIKFGPDLTQQSITIDLINDNIDEPDEERFTVNLSSTFIVANPGLSLAPAVAEVLITDDDQPTIGFSSDKYEINEDSGTVKITVGAFVGVLPRTVDLDYTTRAGSAVPGTDYATRAGSITLSPTVDTVTFEVPIMSDHTVVEDRVFEIDLSLSAGESLPSEFSLGWTTAVVTIEDADTITVGFTREMYTIGEASGTVEIKVALLGGTPLAPGATLEVEFSTDAYTAQGGRDYRHTEATIQLASANTAANPYIVRVPIIDDDLLEYHETFLGRLISDRASVQIGGGPTTAITIVDNDPLTIGFVDSDYNGAVTLDSGLAYIGASYVVNEGEEAELPVAILSGALDGPLTVDYWVLQLNEEDAVASIDYSPTMIIYESRPETPTFFGFQQRGEIELSPDVTRATIRVAINEDDIVDPGEIFAIVLSGSGIPNHVNREPRWAYIRIGDTNGPTVTLTVDTEVIREDSRVADFKVEIPDPTSVDLVLSLTTAHDTDPNTLDEPLDTLIVPDTVTIARGQKSASFTANVVDDNIAELDKVLLLAVSQIENSAVSQIESVDLGPDGTISLYGPINPLVTVDQFEIDNSRYTYRYAEEDRPEVAVVIDSDDTLVLNLETVDGIDDGGILETESRVCVTYGSDQFQYTVDGSRQILELEVREATGELYPGRIYDRDGNSFYRSAVPILLEDGETRSCVSVSHANDHYVGAPLTYTVTLSRTAGLDSSVVLGDSVATVVVAEVDAPELALNYNGITSIYEGQKLDVELQLVNGAPHGLTEELTVELALIYNRGTARAADINFPATVTIPKGANSVAFQIEAVEYMTIDDDKTFELTLVGITPPPPMGTWARFDSGGPITIVDATDRMPTVTITLAAPNVVDEGDRAVFTVNLDGDLKETLTVVLSVTDITATSDDYDTSHPQTQLSVTISPGSRTGQLSLQTVEDMVYEGDETVMLSFSATAGGENVIGLPISRTLTITDNDPTVSLDPLPPQITEGEILTVTARLNRVVDFTVTVRLEIFGGIDPSDYTLSPSEAMIPAGDLSTTFTIDTRDDDVAGGDKLVLTDLIVVSPTSGVGVEEGLRHFTLLDNERTISLDELPMQITEGEGLTVTVRLNRALDFTITIRLETNLFEGSKLMQSIETDKTIPAGDRFTTFTINTRDDGEAGEDILVQLSLSVVSSESVVEVTGGPRYFILLDNAPRVSLDPLPPQITEGEILTVTARLDRVVESGVTVRLEVDISSDIGSPDYTLSRLMATIPAGELSTTFTISTIDDDFVEGDEFGTISLSVISPESVGVGQGVADFILVDNDDPPVVVVTPTILPDSVRLSEGGSEDLKIGLESAAAVDVTFTLELENEVVGVTAGDYSLTPIAVFIGVGERTATVSLTALDDDVREEEEKFDLRLVSASDGVTVTVRRFVTVTIPANDQPTTPPPTGGPFVPPPPPDPDPDPDPEPTPEPEPLTVSLEPSEQTVEEGDDIEVTARLSETAEDDITVTLTASGGTADTDDHGLTMQELTIEAGDLIAMFTISTTDDAIYEPDETLVLRLSSSAEIERDADESVITISDNDPVPTLSLEPNNPSVREGGSITIRARLSNASAEAILVALTLEGVTALPGSDYLLPAELSMEIAPGTEVAEFIIRTVDNSVYEPVETVLLRLSVTEGNVIEGTLAGTLSIIDDDPPPTLSVEAPDEIVEGTTQLVTIRLNGMTIDPVTVRVSAGSDGNVSEDDYTLSPAEVTIEPGQLEATIMLSVIDDGLLEISELLVLEFESDEFETVRHRVTIPGVATALVLVDIDSEAESCDRSGSTCVEVEPDTYSEPLLLVVEELSEPTDDLPPPTEFMYLPGTPLWDIEFLLESDSNLVVSELDDRIRVNLSAPRDVVEANGGTATISIATLHKGSAEWELLETYYDPAGSDDNTYHFYAYTARFSYFALVMLDEVIIEPPVEPSSGSVQPVPLWLLGGIFLAVLVALALPLLVMRRPHPPPR